MGLDPEDQRSWPLDAPAHRRLAAHARGQADEFQALAHEIAAQVLEARAARSLNSPDLPAFSAQPLCDVATGFFTLGRHAAARRWYELVLDLPAEAPVAATAWLNLAAIHDAAGRSDEAFACKREAYQIQRVFVEAPARPLRRLLILCEGQGRGNVPLDTLLATGTNTRVKYVIDAAREAEDASLPDFDLVFNAIGEPDVAPELIQRLERFAATCSRPLLNAPAHVARTQRQNLSHLLGGLADVVVPPCLRLESPPANEAELARVLTDAGLTLPVLVRPWATHGGQGMACCKTLAEAWVACRALTGSYLNAFYDYRSPDGFFRKYRMIFIDRQPLPYHLAIGPQWMVHYFSADMLGHDWKIAEERCYLAEPQAALGTRAMQALSEIAQRLNLDYAGIDFSLLPDGRVLVFEANATMLIHLERQDGALSHKNMHVTRIVAAFEALLARRGAQ